MAQCPSCQFENMPQRTTCVRCGSILPGSHFPIEIEPPRAGKIEKTLHLASVIRTVNRLTGVVAVCFGWIWQHTISLFQLQIRPVDLKILGMFWKGFLPGFAQWYNGRKPHDSVFFFGWLILWFLALLTFGLSVSSFLIGLALAWHLISIIDIAFVTSGRRADRLFLFVTMTISAIFIFYLPTSVLWWNRVGVGRVYLNEAGPLRYGDSLIYMIVREMNTPHVGDLVLYHAPTVRYSSPGQGENANFLFTGDMYDRILAIEGQTVSWEKGTLTIDGKPPLYPPFIPVTQPPDVTFVIPAGHCYIVPGVAFQGNRIQRERQMNLAMPARAEDWQAMGTVPNGSIYGVIWAVRRSLFHFVDIKPGKE